MAPSSRVASANVCGYMDKCVWMSLFYDLHYALVFFLESVCVCVHRIFSAFVLVLAMWRTGLSQGKKKNLPVRQRKLADIPAT